MNKKWERVAAYRKHRETAGAKPTAKKPREDAVAPTAKKKSTEDAQAATQETSRPADVSSSSPPAADDAEGCGRKTEER